VSITGAYSQTAGTLAVAGHVLSVSDAAQVTGGVVNAGLAGTANYLVGDSVTLIRGGNGSTYTGATVTSGLTGLDAVAGTSGSTLLAVAGNDYIGASLATLSVTGTLANTAGGATALYIASTGTLGSLANSGTISGNITNLSANDLVIQGGANGTVGRFTGGTITNTTSNVVFASGAISLGDGIVATGHTVSNAGASLTLASDVAITGAYSQTAGTLAVAGHVLSVSDAASVSGGVVNAGLAGTANYLVGDSVTLIRGGTGSSYTGATVTSGLTGLDAVAGTSGSTLLAVAGNDYIGAGLATLNVTGTLANTAGGATALYIASTGTLGSLANSGVLIGNVVNISTRDLTIQGGANGTVGRFSGGTITNTASNVVFASGAISLADALNV
ncbi:beta strand repeat-containing protein, partial [Nitrospirillum pindoramense]|uniref:beta strand repeat-containing protein n=1 Tax=Nitrospirillum amazonense TaxID=28077 RepID=UPI001B3BFDAA